jgi:parallel beta-helix repeat protein
MMPAKRKSYTLYSVNVLLLLIPLVVIYGAYSLYTHPPRVLGISSPVTYYVDKNSIGGPCSDTNSGVYIDKPFCTINKASSVALAADTIYVRRGTYGPFVITKSGIQGALLTYQAYNGEQVIIDALRQSVDGIALKGTSYVKVYGFEVRGTQGSYKGGIHIKPNGSTLAHHNIIERNKVYNNTGVASTLGIFVEDSGYNIITRNDVHDNYSTGIWVIQHNNITPNGVVGNEISYNKSYNNNLAVGDADGIGLSGGNLKNNIIKNNEVWGNGDDGIDTWTTSGNIVINNIARYNVIGDGNGFKLGGSTSGGNNKVVGNIAYGNKNNGFAANGSGNNRIINNVAYHNGKYGFEDAWKQSYCTIDSCKTTFINNIGFNNSVANVAASRYTAVSHNNIWYDASSNGAKAQYDGSVKNRLVDFFTASGSRLDKPDNGTLSSFAVNPQFRDAANSNFNLLTTSPAINKGDPANPGGIPAVSVPDIGAIETGVETTCTPVNGTWSYGTWSTCTATCGGGTQTRTASCTGTSCGGTCSGTPVTIQACNTQTCTTTVDTTPPAVSITSPLGLQYVGRSTTQNIIASATDNVGVAKVEFYVDGSMICTDTAAPYECSWSLYTKPGVSFTLKAIGYDFAGNNAQASIVVMTN